MSATAIEFRNVTKSYGAGNVLEGFNLTIPAGKIVTLIGPSGCGKTTLLKMINRLVEADSGTILVEGSDVSRVNPVHLRRDIGYVIQQIGLFPHMNIQDNISIVPCLKGGKPKAQRARVDELLEMVGLPPEQFRHRYPHELSGGQQQRIGVARALAAEPSIILMDEPFSALDPISRVQLQNELIRLNRSMRKTIVFVTHDIDEALKIADEIVLLKEGKVVQSASPTELLESPVDDYVRTFVGPERYRAVQGSADSRRYLVSASELLSNPAYANLDHTVAEAAIKLRHEGSEALVVLDREERYEGLLSAEEIFARELSGGGIPLRELLVGQAPRILGSAKISELLPLLKTHSAVPVFDREGHLLGVVTRIGLLEAAAEQFAPEAVAR